MGISGISGISASSIASGAGVAALVTIDTDSRKRLLASVTQNSMQEANATKTTNASNSTNVTISDAANPEISSSPEKTTQLSTQLSDAEEAQLAKLQARDRQVRQHEMAHLAVSGGLATSGASYTYQKGPDGVNYAVGGEVSIDTSPGRTPEDTIARARQIQAAALAPADPSGQDRAVAAQAQHMEIEARAQLAAQASSTTTVKSTEQQSTSAAIDPAQQKIDQLQQAYGISTINSSIDVYA